MADMIETTVSIQETVFRQVKALAQQRNISSSRLFKLAIEQYLAEFAQIDRETDVSVEISQGDVYWVTVEPDGIPHPHVVIQADVLNRSRINTVVVCSLTSNLNRTSWPGNVLLSEHEANLSRQSVVEVSKVSSVKKSQLGEYIGTLTVDRINQILNGMRFLQSSW